MPALGDKLEDLIRRIVREEMDAHPLPATPLPFDTERGGVLPSGWHLARYGTTDAPGREDKVLPHYFAQCALRA